MKRFNLITLLLFIACIASYAQKQIEVADLTQQISSRSAIELFYGFNEGDKLVFSIEDVEGKKLKSIEISQYPSSSIFTTYKTSSVKKTINVPAKGIYKFKIENTAFSKRICKIKITRIAKDAAHEKFNTNVLWHTVYDTLRAPGERRRLIGIDTSSVDVYNSNLMVKAGKRISVDFTLPRNTIAWSYYIGVGQLGESAYNEGIKRFTPIVSSVVSKFSPMAALALTGISTFTEIKNTGNEVRYFFLPSFKSSQDFVTNKTGIKAYKQGTVINEAAQMKNPLKGKIYLGLFNDNMIESIQVTVKATAIVTTEHWDQGTFNPKNITSKSEPYLEK